MDDDRLEPEDCTDDDRLEPEDCTDDELGRGRPHPSALIVAERRRERQQRERWRYLPDDPLPESPPVTATTIGSVVRALRWHARLSQRELAQAAAVSASAVARAEQAGGFDPRLSTLDRLLDACGLQLAVVDDEGTQLAIPFGQNRLRDRADRRLPAHRSRRVRALRRAAGLEHIAGLDQAVALNAAAEQERAAGEQWAARRRRAAEPDADAGGTVDGATGAATND